MEVFVPASLLPLCWRIGKLEVKTKEKSGNQLWQFHPAQICGYLVSALRTIEKNGQISENPKLVIDTYVVQDTFVHLNQKRRRSVLGSALAYARYVFQEPLGTHLASIT